MLLCISLCRRMINYSAKHAYERVAAICFLEIQQNESHDHNTTEILECGYNIRHTHTVFCKKQKTFLHSLVKWSASLMIRTVSVLDFSMKVTGRALAAPTSPSSNWLTSEAFNKCNTISSFSSPCCMTLRISLLLFCSQSFGAAWIPLWYWQWWWWGCNDSGDMQDLATLACLTRTVQPATGWVCVCLCVRIILFPDGSLPGYGLNTRMGEVFWMNKCVRWLCGEKKQTNQKPPVGLCNNNSLYARNFCPCQNSTRMGKKGEGELSQTKPAQQILPTSSC